MTDDVDLNLLRVLDALLEEGGVAAAAERLHLSPPAVSRSLARLRRAIGDPLFVREGRGLVPTPRAEALRSEASSALAAATKALSPDVETFNPSSLTRRFAITADDAIVASIGMDLVKAVAIEAPHVGIDFLPDTNEVSLLRSGRVDLDLGAPHGLGSESESEVLTTITFVAAVRKGHPLTKKKLTLRRYAAAEHVAVSSSGNPLGPVDEALAHDGLHRARVATVPSFITAAHVVATSNVVALLPDLMTDALGPTLGIEALALPFPTSPVEVGQSWHVRFRSDPAHLWLRSMVRHVTARGLTSTRRQDQK